MLINENLREYDEKEKCGLYIEWIRREREDVRGKGK